MGYKHECAGKFQQAIFQHFEGRDIQIIGRLVENEQVCGLEHEPGDEEPCLLTAGQPRHRKIELLWSKEKALRP